MQSSEKTTQSRRTSIVLKLITKVMIEDFKHSIQNAFNNSTNLRFSLPDFIVFENILQYFPYENNKNIKHVVNSSLSINIHHEDEFMKKSTIRVLFLIITFFSFHEALGSSFFDTQENGLMRHFIKKLYQNNLVELDGITMFIRSGIDISLYSNDQIKSLQNPKLLQFIINLFADIVKVGNSVSNEMNLFAKDILTYIDSNLFINPANIYVLRTKNYCLKLLTIAYLPFKSDSNIKQFILNIVFRIYRNSYNDVLNRFLLSNCKHAFMNIQNKPAKKIEKDINKLRTQIEFVSKLIKNDAIDHKTLYTGFIFNDTPKNGLTITGLTMNVKDFTILFSFVQESQNENSEAPLLSFTLIDQADSKTFTSDKVLFSVYVHNSRLVVQFDKTSFVMKSEEIKLNKTYFVCISSGRNIWGSSSSINIGINGKFYKEELKGKCDKVDKLLIGYSMNKANKNNFRGKIGPILYYDSLLEEKTKQLFFKLYNQYDKAIAHSCTNYSFDEKEKNQQIDYDMSALTQFQSNKVFDTLKLVIHPAIILNAFKLKQSYRYFFTIEYNKNKKSDLCSEKRYVFQSIPSPEYFSTFPFVNLESIEQFRNFEGINFLILNIEYFYTLFRTVGKEISSNILNSM